MYEIKAMRWNVVALDLDRPGWFRLAPDSYGDYALPVGTQLEVVAKPAEEKP